MSNRFNFVAIVLALGLVFGMAGSTPANADNLYASIRGTVVDPSGAVVPDAKLTATNVATGINYDTTSNKDGLFTFVQLPIGDYKGYGLSLIIGLLAGALNRAAMGHDVVDFVKETGKATNTGQAIAAISIDTFTPPAEFKRTVDGFIRDLRNSRRLPGVERIWLPGEQSHAKLLDRRAHGVPMPKSLRESLDTLAGDLSIAPLE